MYERFNQRHECFMICKYHFNFSSILYTLLFLLILNMVIVLSLFYYMYLQSLTINNLYYNSKLEYNNVNILCMDYLDEASSQVIKFHQNLLILIFLILSFPPYFSSFQKYCLFSCYPSLHTTWSGVEKTFILVICS